ncbi:hypothetical protein F5Y06DRAFT_308130 [Hypoxylon sp. FL0890]|nr:hypothetical protein F5Y06DRAFT_308130 [Hypoxylon sp. FL0890]
MHANRLLMVLHALALGILAQHDSILTVVRKRTVTTAQSPDVIIAAVDPTSSGQIGVNPVSINVPPVSQITGSIGVNTQYLTDLKTFTSWIGPDPSHIVVTPVTKTTTVSGQTTHIVATATVNVQASKEANGDISILLSPVIMGKLSAIAAKVPPCAAKRKKRQAACGLEAFTNEVQADPELAQGFGDELASEVWAEVDEGYVGSPEDGPDFEFEGDGENGYDSGYESGEEGWFEGVEGGAEGAAEGTLEAIAFASPEEAGTLIGTAAAPPTLLSFLNYVWKVYQENKDVPPVFKIPSANVNKITKTKTSSATKTTTSETSTSSSSCPTQRPNCDDKCLAKADPDDNRIGRCSQGDHKGCICNPLVQAFTEYTIPGLQQVLEDALDAIGTYPAPDGLSDCDTSKLSTLPQKAFDGIWTQFCGVANGSESGVTWPVDINGNKIPPKAKEASVMPRSPPTDKDQYKDYVTTLTWTPAAGGDDCWSACGDAYGQGENDCGVGTNDKMMTTDGTVDIGCGNYSWHIEPPPSPPPTPPKTPRNHLSGQVCNNPNGWPSHSDTQPSAQDWWSHWFCNEPSTKGRGLGPGMTASTWDTETGSLFKRGSHMWFKISWIDGCELDSDTQSQIQTSPVPDTSVTCYSLFRHDYTDCNNGGIGGSRDAGCLRYEFWAN